MTKDVDSIYVARIVESTSSDGLGLRNSLYVSGCNIQCPQCHNKHLWDIKAGKEMSLQEVFDKLNQDEFNISILGGEPLMQYPQILKLCKKIKAETTKTIWFYSGHTLLQIRRDYPAILDYIDVLVDGPYQEAHKKPNLRFRGSDNQKIYIVKGQNEIYPYEI